VLCACGASQPSSSSTSIPSQLAGPVHIDYWERYCSDAMTSSINEFNREQAGKIVVTDVCQGVSQDQIAAKVMAAAAAGSLPQVVAAGDDYVTQYNAGHIVVPLEDYVNSAKWGVSASEMSDFYAGTIGRTKLPVSGNRRLSWTQGSTANALYYNKDPLAKAGIQQPPTTWDEFVSDTRAIKNATGKPGWVLPTGDGSDFIDLLWAYGYPWIRSDGKTANFDNASAVKILTDWQNLTNDGSALVTDSAKNAFTGGQAGMVFASSGYTLGAFSSISGFNWGLGGLPHASGKPPLTELYGSVNVMLKSDPQKQLASWVFMKWWASPANQAAYCAGGGGCFPATKSSATMAIVAQAKQQTPPYGTALDQIAPYAQLIPENAALNRVDGEISGNVITQVQLKQLTPGDAAKKLQSDATQAIQTGG